MEAWGSNPHRQVVDASSSSCAWQKIQGLLHRIPCTWSFCPGICCISTSIRASHISFQKEVVLQVLLQHWAWRIVYMCHHVSRFQITAYPVVAYWLECLLVCSDDQTEHNGHLAPARTGKTSQQIADLDKASCAYYIYIYIHMCFHIYILCTYIYIIFISYCILYIWYVNHMHVQHVCLGPTIWG